MKINYLLLLTLLSALAISCSSSKPIPPEVDEIVYHFSDSSVPSEYHRSYTIVVTPNEATVAVNSYGDVLAEDRVAVSAEIFQSIKTSFETNEIRSCRVKDDNGCTGGTGESISYGSAGDELFSEGVYHCGKSSGGLCGELDAFSADIRALIPNLQALLNTPLPEQNEDGS